MDKAQRYRAKGTNHNVHRTTTSARMTAIFDFVFQFCRKHELPFLIGLNVAYAEVYEGYLEVRVEIQNSKSILEFRLHQDQGTKHWYVSSPASASPSHKCSFLFSKLSCTRFFVVSADEKGIYQFEETP